MIVLKKNNMLPVDCGFQNRRLAGYRWSALVIIYVAARAAALQKVFEIRTLPRAYYFF